MKRYVIFIFLANMLVCSSVYSVHHFLKVLYNNMLGADCRFLSLLDILTIVRLASAYMISNIADRTQKHFSVAILCLAGYVSTISAMCLCYRIIKNLEFGKKPVIIVIDILIKVFDSGIFPVMETLVINASILKGCSKKTYSYMRFSTVIGRTLPQITNMVFGYKKGKKPIDECVIMVGVSLLYFVLCVPFFALANAAKANTEENEAIVEKPKKRIFWRSLGRIIFSEYALILIFVGCQGVHRTVVTNYQQLMLKSAFQGSDKSILKTRLVPAIRCVPELLIELSAPYVEKLVGAFWMVIIGSTAGITKTLAYAYQPQDISSTFKLLYFIFFESFKALFSSFMSYGCTKLTKYYNPPEIQTSAQGLYNGMYNAVGGAISGVIGYFTIQTDSQRRKDEFHSFLFVSSLVGMVGIVPVVYLIVMESKPWAKVTRSIK